MLIKTLASRRIFSVLAYLAIAAVISFLVMDRYIPSLKVGDSAPTDDKIMAFSGALSSFKSLSARKVLVVNFWATWCPPCQKELPILSKLAAKYASEISFVGASVDSNKEDVLALRAHYSLNYWLGFVDPSVVSHWQAQILPTTYIIDKSGKIVWAKSGALSEEAFESALSMALRK